MIQDELQDLIEGLRRYGSDHAAVEAKASRQALPKRLWESLSSFSNTSNGGVIILGLDEEVGFEVVGVQEIKKVQADLAAMCTEMEPVLRPDIQFFEIEGKTLIVAEIPELPVDQKPCYHRHQGLINGSYIRVGDGNRQMNAYEIHALQEAKGQPRHDLEPVPGTTLEDLDQELLQGFLRRIKAQRKGFEAWTDERVLSILKILVPDSTGQMVLSLAGWLSMAVFPQSLFPNLCMTIVRYPSDNAGDTGPQGERFLENVKIEGPIPFMVQEALRVLKRNMQRRDIIHGLGREEQWEYPELVLREAIVNALAHRDLSYMARSAHVQLQIFPDRLEIISPGGLYGPIQPEQLGIPGTQSSRNEFLINILEDLPLPGTNHTLCEGRGSGITAMLSLLRKSGMSPPRFDITLPRFKICLWNHTLLNPEVLTWLNQIAEGHALTESQRKGLAYTKYAKSMSNVDYCRVTGADSRLATKELKQLVDMRILERINNRRWAHYCLAENAPKTRQKWRPKTPSLVRNSPVQSGPKPSQRDVVLNTLKESKAPLSILEITNILGVPKSTVRFWVKILMKEGEITRNTTHPNAPNSRYYCI